ncbi:MAG: hypothetical protein H5U36_01140 [Candidatus Caldatribacterium sp.]|nr:hypothetical protein [Candidatus Caldatribacterium sp.]
MRVRLSSPCSISCSLFWAVLLLAFEGVAWGRLSLSVSPPLVELALPPGGVKRFTVSLTNEGEVNALVAVRFVSFALSPDGEVVFLEEPDAFSLAPWMSTKGKNPLVLRGGEKRELLFEIRVPHRGQGGRYGAVLFEALPAETPSGMAVGIRLGTLILGTFPHSSGARGKIVDLRVEKGRIEVEVENVGDVHFPVSEGEVVVKTDVGRVLRRVHLEGTGLLLPGGRRLLQGELGEEVLPEGCTFEVRVFTPRRNRRVLLDRMVVSSPDKGGGGERKDKEESQGVE